MPIPSAIALIDEQRTWEHADLIAERQQHDADWNAWVAPMTREMETTIAVRILQTRDPDAPENGSPTRKPSGSPGSFASTTVAC